MVSKALKDTVLRTTNRKPHPLTEEAEKGRKDGSGGGGPFYSTISKVTRLGTACGSEEAPIHTILTALNVLLGPLHSATRLMPLPGHTGKSCLRTFARSVHPL